MKITDWRELENGDIILVEGKERRVYDTAFKDEDDFWEDAPYVIELHPEDCEGLNLQNDTWFNTKLHPWVYVRRDKECWIED